MKPFLSHPSAVRWLSVMVITASLARVSPGRAQGVDVASIQEQGDEMSRQVGGFFRKLFYGEDRNSQPYQQPQYQQPQRQYQQAPQPYQTAPQRQQGYQYAPPPSGSNQQSAPQRQRPLPQQAPATASRKPSSHAAEPEKTKRSKEVPPPKISGNTTKRPAVQNTPPKHEEEPPAKPVSKRKSYTPPTMADNDSSESKPKKTVKSEPPAPERKDSVAKTPRQAEPPAHKFEPSETKSKPSSPKDEPGGLSPYSDGYAGGTTVMAPKETPATKPQAEEPKKETKLNTSSAPTDGSFPTGTRSKNNPGSVVSPYSPYNELDVSGLPSGSLAIDPTTKKVFKVP